MKAIILCAGYGKRLQPFTNYLPKPLFPIIGTPLINKIIYKLKELDVEEICINTHHLSDKITNYLRQKEDFDITFNFSCEPEILGVAGGIGKMEKWLRGENTFIVHNGDILSNINIKKALDFHNRGSALITLILHDYKEFNKITISQDNEILCIDKFQSKGTLAFTGISIMSGKVFDFLPRNGKYGDIIPVYQELIKKRCIRGYVSIGHFWSDIGTPERYLEVHKFILSGKERFFLTPYKNNLCVGENSIISPTAKLKGFMSIGKNCNIKDYVVLEDCVVWDSVTIPSNTVAKGKIFYKSGNENQNKKSN